VRKKGVALLLASQVILSGCSTQATPISNPEPHIVLSKDACEQAWMTPLIPNDNNDFGDRPVLAGGSIRSGDFVVALWLYCDASLSDESIDGANYSEIGYLGIRTEWTYVGLPIEHGSSTILAVNGKQINESGGGPRIGTGDSESGEGPWRTPDLSVAQAVINGKPVEFLLSVYTPDPAAAAKLTVQFTPAKDGYVVARTELVPVQA
jgi:hypothetical protein